MNEQEKPSKRRTFEYKTLHMFPRDMESEQTTEMMNGLGLEGWELVSVNLSTTAPVVFYTLKRELL